MVLKALVASLSVLSVFAVPSQAAVRTCKSAVNSGPHVAKSVAEGQTRAIAAWTAAAGVSGARFSAWRVAISKSLTCTPFTEHQVVCVAIASPCAIEQVAPRNFVPGLPSTPQPRVIPVQPPGAKPLNI